MMKKIFSLLAAGFLALGLMGCSGLHDAVAGAPVELSEEFYLVGSFSDWAAPAGEGSVQLVKGNGDYIWTAGFTANDAVVKFSIAKSGWAEQKGGNDFTAGTLPDGVKYSTEDNGNGGINGEFSGLKTGTYYTMTIDCSSGIVISLESAEAPAQPVPYYLDGYYLVGCSTPGLKFDFNDLKFLIWGATLDKTTGNLTYIKDFECKALCSDDWHDGGEGVIKISTTGWTAQYGKTKITVNGDFVEWEASEDNSIVSGLKANSHYRLTIKTTPDKKVYAKIEEIASYTLKFEVTNLEEGNVAWINGSFWGSWDLGWPITSWNAPTKEGYDAAVADSAGVAAFDSKWNVTGAGKIGDTLSWEFKALAAESESAWNDEKNLILNPGSNMSCELELEKSGTYKVSINAQTEKVVCKLEE